MPFRGVYLFALLLLDLLFACQGIIRASSRLLVQPGIVLEYSSTEVPAGFWLFNRGVLEHCTCTVSCGIVL